MRTPNALIAGALLLAGVTGCANGAPDVDFPPSRSVDADISATHFNGPTSAYPGMLQRNEPLGAFPWNMDERHQSE